MKKLSVLKFFPLMLTLLILFYSSSGFSSEYKDMGIPAVQSRSLENGVKIFHITDELPRTVFYVSVGYGRLYEDKESAGISELLTRTLSIGGTKKFPGNELYSRLESIGGEINFIPGWENIVIELKVLSRHRDLAFEILSDIFLNPLFDEESLKSAKSLLTEKIKREKDNPRDIAFEVLREIIFCGSGYGGRPSEKTIDSVSATDLRKIWDKYFRGANVSIAVSTSVEADDFFKSAEKSFSSIQKGDRLYYDTDNVCIINSLNENSRNIYLIPMDLEQATIVTGTAAPQLNYDGNYALHLMNYILGGGSFNSRLTSEIRVKRGLAYSVFSLVRNRYSTGVFMSFVQTRNENAPLVLSLIRENVEDMFKKEVSSEEITWARESIINSYIFRFEKISHILANYLDIDYNGLDYNYYRDYPERINRVTAGEIKAEAEKLFSRGMITVIAGDRKIAEELKKYGNVIILENAGD